MQKIEIWRFEGMCWREPLSYTYKLPDWLEDWQINFGVSDETTRLLCKR